MSTQGISDVAGVSKKPSGVRTEAPGKPLKSVPEESEADEGQSRRIAEPVAFTTSPTVAW